MSFFIAAGASLFVMIQMEKRGHSNMSIAFAMMATFAAVSLLLTGDLMGALPADYDPSETCNGRC